MNKLFKVAYSARYPGSGFIAQSMVVPAASEADALKVANATLARQCKAGAWFVDFRVASAARVG